MNAKDKNFIGICLKSIAADAALIEVEHPEDLHWRPSDLVTKLDKLQGKINKTKQVIEKVQRG